MRSRLPAPQIRDTQPFTCGGDRKLREHIFVKTYSSADNVVVPN
jgi:hypothetical protein